MIDLIKNIIKKISKIGISLSFDLPTFYKEKHNKKDKK
jgi:cell division FtsZ-interacting protein ZapD